MFAQILCGFVCLWCSVFDAIGWASAHKNWQSPNVYPWLSSLTWSKSGKVSQLNIKKKPIVVILAVILKYLVILSISVQYAVSAVESNFVKMCFPSVNKPTSKLMNEFLWNFGNDVPWILCFNCFVGWKFHIIVQLLCYFWLTGNAHTVTQHSLITKSWNVLIFSVDKQGSCHV